MNKPPQISVIIVNYNVRDFLLHALQSIQRALKNFASEIIVVDNASVDGSVQYLEKNFPDVKIISNNKNVGFSSANNQALRIAKGKFIVLINPDTVVQEDTFSSLVKFMEEHPDAGAATCKILNPDGSFSIDCRHSIPTPLTAFWKLIGFNRLFPGSKIFGRYNLTYLDPDDTYQVDAISGSFMFIRKEVFEQTGYLDEDFFMYCEDIDFCYRINRSGWKIYYVPESNIIHYKGESTKKNNLDYVINFNKSLYLFYKKHFQQKYITPFRWLILFGVMLRGIFVYLKNFFTTNFAIVLDLTILNTVILTTFILRYEAKSGFLWEDFWGHYIIINVMASAIFFVSSVIMELHRRFRFSLAQTIKANLLTFIILSAITFFLKQFAFSRLIVIIASFVSPIVMLGWRFILRRLGKTEKNIVRRDLFRKRTILVGTEFQTQQIAKKMRVQPQPGFELIGIAAEKEEEIGQVFEGVPVVTSLSSLREYARLEKIDQIIFSTHNIAYETILKTMSRMDDLRIDFKIIPENLEVIIGKSSVERLVDYPLVEINFAIGKPFNKLTKRVVDIVISGFILLSTIPIWLAVKLITKKYLSKIEIWGAQGQLFSIVQLNSKPFEGWLNKLLLLKSVFSGRMSLVGAPIRLKESGQPLYFYKPGWTGMVQINQYRISDAADAEKFELYYLKNQNFWLDMEIIFKQFYKVGAKHSTN